MVSQIGGNLSYFSSKSLFMFTTQEAPNLRIIAPFIMGIHRWQVDSIHKGPVMRKVFPRHDVIMTTETRRD